MGDGKIICAVFVYYYFSSWDIKETDNILFLFDEESWWEFCLECAENPIFIP